MRTVLVALLSGVIFALGLAISGMTDPAKVEAFLDLGGGWDPSLAFVMGGAIGVHALAYVLQRRLPGPVGRPHGWTLAPLHGVDGWLVGGAALFGIGWGIAGWCPGPALVSVATLGTPVLTFVAALLVGGAVGGVVRRRARAVRGPTGTVPAAADPTETICG
jgi:uncharacterized membrane protein YedE/YeeE